jgi:hypothetical protein
MAANLVLNDLEEDILKFVLDMVIEEWEDKAEGQFKIMATDPSITTLEELLEVTGSVAEMQKTLQRIRFRIGVRREVTND